MQFHPPYLLFIGDATDPLSIKMARSVADWRPEKCIGELQMPGCTVTTGQPIKTIAQAAEEGAKTLILGFANSGGYLDASWVDTILEALDAGMDIVSGLHDKLIDIPSVADKAMAAEIVPPPARIGVPSGEMACSNFCSLFC